MIHQLQEGLVGMGLTVRQIGLKQDRVAICLVRWAVGVALVRGLKGGVVPMERIEDLGEKADFVPTVNIVIWQETGPEDVASSGYAPDCRERQRSGAPHL